MGERFPYKEEVGGSIPSTPTTSSTSYCDIVAGQCFDLESDLANIAGCSVLLEYGPARGAREA